MVFTLITKTGRVGWRGYVDRAYAAGLLIKWHIEAVQTRQSSLLAF